MHKYSPEDLLLYLYKETDANVNAAIEEELRKDWALREKLAVMKTSMERLNAITESPRTQVILNILKQAGAKDTVPSK